MIATRHSDGVPDDAAAQVVIIGGGITGLTAAYAIERGAEAAGVRVAVTLVEREGRLGGKILTERVATEAGELVIEGGPDSFVAQKPQAMELARELGIGDRLHGSEPNREATLVLRGGRLTALPEGTHLVVPTKLWPFVKSPLFSPLGKLRMGMDLLIPPRRDEGDESLASFIRRRLGGEALDRLAEPLMGGIHSADSERQSLLATFPRFADIERRHGSLIRGMVAARRAAAGKPREASSPFMTLRGGVGTLVEALAARLGCRVLLGRSATGVSRGIDGRYRVRLDDGGALDADALIVTTPAYAAADLLGGLAPDLAGALRSIRYVTTATVTLCVPEAAIAPGVRGYGVIIPHSEGRKINALTISSRKFAGRAPAGTALVRAFVGGSRTPEALELDDAGLVALARREVREILGVDSAPSLARVYRWERGNPQYDVGHLARAAEVERLQPEGILIAGGAYRGVGIPDCIREGREAARAALAHVGALSAAHGGRP